MPISSEHVGRSYPPAAPYQVSKAKIVEFATALGDLSPNYVGPTPIAPPTFAALIAAQAWEALFGDEELGLSLNRTVHADQRFEFERPLRPGDEVQARLTIEKVRNRGQLDIVGIRVDLLVDDALVCAANSTLMHTREAVE